MAKDRQDFVMWERGKSDEAVVVHDSNHGRPDTHSSPHGHDLHGKDGREFKTARDLTPEEQKVFDAAKKGK
jgi:hypothetical protein